MNGIQDTMPAKDTIGFQHLARSNPSVLQAILLVLGPQAALKTTEEKSCTADSSFWQQPKLFGKYFALKTFFSWFSLLPPRCLQSLEFTLQQIFYRCPSSFPAFYLPLGCRTKLSNQGQREVLGGLSAAAVVPLVCSASENIKKLQTSS